MMIPLWVAAGCGALLLNTVLPLIQETMKADAFALAFWNKVFSVLLMVPFVLYTGLPVDPGFYTVCALSAVMWCVSDVYYFRALPDVGAAVVTRLLPSAIIVTFFLWFAFDPALLRAYIASPWHSAAITLVVLLAAYFSTRLRHCAVSWRAVGLIWPVLFAYALGPINQKIALGHATGAQGPVAFVFVQGIMMVAVFSFYVFFRAPQNRAAIMAVRPAKVAALVSVFSAFSVVLRSIALNHVEHPAYLSVLLLADSMLILLIHRALGREDSSDLVAGFGVVACAAGLAVIRSLH